MPVAGQRENAACERDELQSSGKLNSNGAREKLERLKTLLEESRYVFREQESRARRLHDLLEKRLGNRVPENVGYDETFFLLHPDFNEEEMEVFRLIRSMTSGPMRLVNAAMRQWAQENRASTLGILHSPVAKQFDKKLRQLRLHLDLWFDRYDAVFTASERRSLVYLLDLNVPGVSFPVNLDKTVQKLLEELK